jgi:hypothetical protein
MNNEIPWRTIVTKFLIQGKTYLEFALQRDFHETGQCRLSLAEGEFLKGYFAFALPKNSLLTDVFNPK